MKKVGSIKLLQNSDDFTRNSKSPRFGQLKCPAPQQDKDRYWPMFLIAYRSTEYINWDDSSHGSMWKRKRRGHSMMFRSSKEVREEVEHYAD